MNTFLIAVTYVFMMVFLGVFVYSFLLALWYIAKHSRLFAIPLAGLYIVMGFDWHYMGISDNKYSDVSHGFLGTWNSRVFMLFVLVALALQIYIIIKNQKFKLKLLNRFKLTAKK